MAYVNVKDWSVDQVTEWLKGLDTVTAPYIKSFLNNGVKGHQLLSLRADDLEHLGVLTLGHQETILEAVEHLRNFHYELDRENLQMLALRLSCVANSLSKELQLTDENCTMVPTQTMSDVHNIIATIKPLVCWLDRAPFRGDADYAECKTDLLQLSLEMATSAHRDIFSEKPLRTIRHLAAKLGQLADRIVQEMGDPMILQPASLALATVKKKEQDIGFLLLPNNTAVHQIAEIKYGSPAHTSSKIEEGDEIAQVNYQTVVGWQRKKLLLLLQESPPEIVLTLKKRPRHTKIYGQIYMKPYRLPSKKRATPYSRWNDNLPSPQLLAIPDLPQILPPSPQSVQTKDDIKMELESCNSSDSEPLDGPGEGRVYPLKPHPVLQRRNTIAEDTPMSKRPHQAIEQYYQLLKNQAAFKHSSTYNIPADKYDDEAMHKSASCSDGLEMRPRTVIGLATTTKPTTATTAGASFRKKRVNFDDCHVFHSTEIKSKNLVVDALEERSVSVNSLSSVHDPIDYIDEGVEITDRSDMRTDAQEKATQQQEPTIDAALSDVHVHNIIRKFDGRDGAEGKMAPEKPPQLPQKKEPLRKPVVPPKTVNRKMLSQMSKSHSTPAYDQSEGDAMPLRSPKLPETKSASPPPPPPRDLYDTTSLTHKNIKYELGIPMVESPTYLSKPIDYEQQQQPLTNTYEDIPPKPPPRNFPPDAQKHAHNAQEAPTPAPRHLPPPPSPAAVVTAYLEPSTMMSKLKVSMESLEINATTSTPIKVHKEVAVEELKDTTAKVESKISPTNSVVRAMIYSNKSKAKKKSSLIAKRRRVSVKDLSPGEMQGHLYQRLRTKHCQTAHWEKRWFVLNHTHLYGFTTRESARATCLIFLSGFTVSLASEVKSRANAFKVYHTGTVFYFSADDADTLNTWIELITAATLVYDPLKCGDAFYSETDDSDAEKRSGTDKSHEPIRKFGSLKKFTGKTSGGSGSSPQTGSSSLDRKWFFNKSNSAKHAQPVPTAQFRSYRKIASGMSMSTGNFISHIPDFVTRVDVTESPPSTVPQQRVLPHVYHDSHKLAKARAPKPYLHHHYHYVHASNPNLCDLSSGGGGGFHKQPPQLSSAHDNLAGFVTLEELMNRQAEEQRLNPHHVGTTAQPPMIDPELVAATVVYGEVPLREYARDADEMGRREAEAAAAVAPARSESTSSCFGKRSGSIKKQKREEAGRNLNRSLPRTHRPMDAASLRKSGGAEERGKLAGSKEYSASFVDLKSEMVYNCARQMADVQFAQNRVLEGTQPQPQRRFFRLHRQHSLTSADKKEKAVKLKSAGQYAALPLPVADQARAGTRLATFETGGEERAAAGGKTGMLRGFFGRQEGRRGFLGSPKMARVVERDGKGTQLAWPTETLEESKGALDTSYSMEDLTCGRNKELFPPIMNSPTIDYPGLEYPPVFEPETYSLADPQCSISLLRKDK